jgi:hypothetical protein
MNKIEIPLSKSKNSLLLIGVLVFVFVGWLFIMNPGKYVSIICKDPEKIRIAGISSVLFFSAAGVYGFIKLFDKSIGLIIDEKGITDNSNASSVGLIEWSDIIEIRIEHVMSTRFLLIFVTNPDKYLSRMNFFKRILMKGNMISYGTPLSITSNSLRFKFDDLERIIKVRFNKQKVTMPNR